MAARSLGNSKRSASSLSTTSSTTTSASSVGFSAFLMDEVPDFTARPQRNGARPHVFPASVPIAVPNLPALQPARSTSNSNAVPLTPTSTAVSSNSPVASAPSTTTVATIATRTRSAIQREHDDIPVLEAGGLYVDDNDVILGHDDGDDNGSNDSSSDDDDGEDAIAIADELADDVPVLQTREDAQAMGSSTLGSKKFSWRESSRHVVTAKRSVRTEPDAAVLLRMSSASELTSSSSSGSLISRKEPLVVIDQQIVRRGWLYKQADILKTWKRRYFVLIKRTNTHTGEFAAALKYFKGANFGTLGNEISLQDGPLTVRFMEAYETKRPYCFEIAGPDFAYVCQGTGDEDVSAWVCHLQSLTGSVGEIAAGAVGTAAAGGLQPGGLASGAMDDRSIRIVAELRRLLHTSKSTEAAKCRAFVRTFECRSTSSLRQLRDFHAALTNEIVETHARRILTLLDEPSSSTSTTTSTTTSTSTTSTTTSTVTRSDVRSAVSRHVEEMLFQSLQEPISAFLRRAFHDDEAAINRKVRWLQGKDQTYYNIPAHQISWKEWRRASKVLAQMAHRALPSAKYDVLLATIAAIQTTFREDRRTTAAIGPSTSITTSTTTSTTVAPLETDDVIPIFTYVLANSGLENLLAVKTLLTELNGAWTIGGAPDGGAALSVLTHAVDLIRDVSIPAVLEDIFKDQITLSIDGDWRRVLELDVEPTYRYGAFVSAVSPHGYSAVGTKITRGHVLVTVNGQNVVLWPFSAIAALLTTSTPPHRLAFIPAASYSKILTATKSLWNVALVHACQRGDVGSVQMLLANGADVNYVAHECGGNAPLHIAVSALHFSVVSYLLQHGAKVKARGECGRTALHMVGAPCTLPSSAAATTLGVAASAHGSATMLTTSSSVGRAPDRAVLIVKKLLAHGAELEPVDVYGNTPLMLLAEQGCLAALDVLVEADGHVDLDARNWKSGLNALALAARAGRLDVVEALLDYGVQLDVCSLRGETALHFAAGLAHHAICSELLARGCDVDARTAQGRTPLMVAVARGDDLTPPTAVVSAAPATTKRKPLPTVSESYISSRPNSVDTDAAVLATIDLLLASGADKNAVCARYRLPLHYAALSGGAAVYNHVLARMDDAAAAAATRDLFGDTAAAMAQAAAATTRRSDDDNVVGQDDAVVAAGEGDATGETEGDDVDGHDDSDDDDSDDDDVDSDDDDDDDDAADIPMSLGECQRNGDVASVDIVIETRDGKAEIVAGTFQAIVRELLQADAYRLDEMDAFIWYCEYGAHTREMVDFLRELLHQHAETPAALYVRRMVLHALDRIVQNLKHQVECAPAVSAYISAFCDELFPLALGDDPQCAQWLSASLLPLFVDAWRAHRLAEFQVLTGCERDYTALKQFLVAAKQSHGDSLAFLDDELFASAAGIEIISESMRRRLSIAGVWTSDAKKSFVVRSDNGTTSIPSQQQSQLPTLMRVASSSSVTAWQPRGLGRAVQANAGRPWILDLDASVIAQQITLFQHYLFSKIKVSEVLASKKSAAKTPAYQRLRLLHNHISVWVVGQILARDDLDQRAEMLSYFIKVAGVLLHPLQNLDGFMAVMNAANDTSIFRLKKTWGRLSAQRRDAWFELKQYTEKGARPLNKLTKEGVPPLIPYMGVVIQNIIALQEFPDHVEVDRINFKKIRSIGGLIQRFLSFQNAPYLLPCDKRVLDFICTSLPYPNPDACYERSIKLEPRVEAPSSSA